MQFQTVIVAIILLAAFFYAAAMFWRKTKSFSPKNNSCGNDCGCDSKSKIKN